MSDETQTPIADALSKPIVIPDLPDDTIVLAAEKTKDDFGATLSAEVDPGEPGGFFAGGMAAYWRHQGYKAMAWVGWRPNKKRDTSDL